jgi:hypothetical protein
MSDELWRRVKARQAQRSARVGLRVKAGLRRAPGAGHKLRSRLNLGRKSSRFDSSPWHQIIFIYQNNTTYLCLVSSPRKEVEHGRTRVTGVGSLNRVDRQRADRADAELIELGIGHGRYLAPLGTMDASCSEACDERE